jgi:hypothetical protein
MHFLDQFPMWAIYLFTILLGLLAVEAGFRLGKIWKKRHPEESETHIGAMIGATLGLWAFLLAFLVGIAINRYDARREIVIAEANAIGTAWLRAGTQAEPYSSQSQVLLEEYAQARLNFAGFETHLAGRARSEQLHVLLWKLVEQMTASESPNPVMSIYIASLNEVIDLHTTRLAAITTARIPYTLYLAMYMVAMLALLMLGFHSGITGQRDIIVTVVLIFIFSTIMLLIIDLDRSWAGFLRTSQQPMIDLVRSFGTFR